jgi:hypothetical protein
MMEFEEMQKFWNEQKGETMYAINETALHRSVTHKKDVVSRRINRVEIMISIINGLAGAFLFVLAVIRPHMLNFINAGIIVATVSYIQYFRWKRKKAENTFDRSMLGELDHAISNANFMIRFNYLMRVGYVIPLSVVCISALIVGEATWEKWLITTGALLLSFLLFRWEQRTCNVPSKKQLLALKKKLMEE